MASPPHASPSGSSPMSLLIPASNFAPIFSFFRAYGPQTPASRSPPPPSLDLSALQTGVTVHIIELTFTSHDTEALESKEQQHALLAHHLQTAGWTLSQADITHRPGHTFIPVSPPAPASPPPFTITSITRPPHAPPHSTKLVIRFQRRPPPADVLLPPPPPPLQSPLAPAPMAPVRLRHSSQRVTTRTRRRTTTGPRSTPPTPPSPLAAATAGGGGGLPLAGMSAGPRRTALAQPASPSTLLYLSRFVHIVLIGTDGSLFRPLDSFLTDVLLLPFHESLSLLHRLNGHSIYYTNTIIRWRRALDFDPTAVRIPLRNFHDPP